MFYNENELNKNKLMLIDLRNSEQFSTKKSQVKYLSEYLKVVDPDR